MENQNLLLVSLVLAPIIIGVMVRVANFSFSSLKFISLATTSILGLTLAFSVNQNPSIKFLVLAVLLMGFCVMICQKKLQQIPNFYSMYGNYRVDLGRIAGSGTFEPTFSLCPPRVYGIFYSPTKENLT